MDKIKYVILTSYITVCFSSYFIFVYPALSNVLLALSIPCLLSTKYVFSRNRILLALLMLLLFIHTSISYELGLKPHRYGLLLLVYPFIRSEELLKLYRYFKIGFLLSTIPSILVLLLHMIGMKDLIPSYQIFAGRFFIVYPGTVLQPLEFRNIYGFVFYRVSGVYGEPGMLGTVALFLLMAENFDLSKRDNRYILAIGLVSFSLAFYVLLAGYFVLTMIRVANLRSIIARLFMVLMFFVVAQSQIFSMYVMDRVGNVSANRSVEVQLRTNVSSEVFFNYFFSLDMQTILLGRGQNAANSDNAFRGSQNISYMAYVYNYGMLGLFYLFVVIFIILITFMKDRNLALIYLILIIGSFIQRPYILNNGYFFAFFIIPIVSHYNAIRNKQYLT